MNIFPRLVLFTEDAVTSVNHVANLLGIENYATVPSNLTSVDSSLRLACDVLWVRFGCKIDRDLIDNFPKLRLIVSSTTGKSHIDVDYLSEKQIGFIYLGDSTKKVEHVTSTPELAWFLIQLSQFRNLSAVISIDATFEKRRQASERSRNLSSQQIGIVGLGRIGRRIATVASAFGLRVQFFDPFYHGPLATEYSRVTDLRELFETSQIVSLHASLNSENFEMVNKNAFRNCTGELVLVNTARAELVNEYDVLEALSMGKLNKYLADVYEGDANGSDVGPLCKAFNAQKFAERLFLTPHVGGFSSESWHLVENVLVREVLQHIEKWK